MKKLSSITILAGLTFVLGVAILSTAAVNQGAIRTTLPSPALKSLAQERNLQLGSYAALKRLNEPAYVDILTKQFGFITIDGQPNWQFNDGQLRPSEQAYDFSRIDRVMDFAKDHNMPVQMHHFVWGEEKWLPDWLKYGNYTHQQLLDLMEQHIKTVGSHYQGQVREWTVVNEAFTRARHENGLNDWWGQRLGQNYVDQAFVWARQADPEASLILNDFGIEAFTPAANDMYEYVRNAKARGIPIDGIGMQMHIDGSNPPKKQDVIANMQRFADLGLKIYVTEFDVTVNDFHAPEPEKQIRQAAVYHDMLRACIESAVCHSFALLGITDKESWYNELGTPAADPLPFDNNYQPKPAFWAMRESLKQP